MRVVVVAAVPETLDGGQQGQARGQHKAQRCHVRRHQGHVWVPRGGSGEGMGARSGPGLVSPKTSGSPNYYAPGGPSPSQWARVGDISIFFGKWNNDGMMFFFPGLGLGSSPVQQPLNVCL